ncbi:Hypothetical predicted protein [Olea europaea subsp. europaea]|uniref:Uncharacterized protein n=1 Tax=Olea europaea subsp. europaea TaxID=158383 RepID=A0A8S0T3Z7_OLEEU|nr:Hypothetical predicted protein [Olea europaea subsp. europaea]
MPENQAGFLLWLGRVQDMAYMAYTSCPKNHREMPENKAAFLLRPRLGMHTVSKKLPRMPRNEPTSLTWSAHHVAFAASLSRLQHRLHTVSQKLPRNAWNPGCVPAVAKKHPENGLHTVP